MNQDNFNLLVQDIIEHTISEDEKLLARMHITCDKALPPLEFLFRIFGKPCFPRGELVAVTGKAKSGKTMFTSMLMACSVLDEVLQVQRPFEDIGGAWTSKAIHCLWYDTEQSEQSTQEILRDRINKWIHLSESKTLVSDSDPLSYFHVFNARCLHYKERLRLFDKAVRMYKPDIVILDGVRDLIADINDGIQAQMIVEQLMRLAQEVRCCLVCVLHQNKGAEDRNLRGCIGTEMMNKAFEVYACEKVKPDSIFVVEQTHTRKYDLDQMLFFKMDPETELPVISDAPILYASDGYCASNGQKKEKMPPMNPDYVWFDDKKLMHIRKQDLFYEALKTGPMYYNDLQTRVINLLRCGTPMWNNMFCEMRDAGYIVRTKNNQGKSVWKLATANSQQQELPLEQPPNQA